MEQQMKQRAWKPSSDDLQTTNKHNVPINQRYFSIYQHKSSSKDASYFFTVLECKWFSTDNTKYNVQLILVTIFEFTSGTRGFKINVSYDPLCQKGLKAPRCLAIPTTSTTET